MKPFKFAVIVFSSMFAAVPAIRAQNAPHVFTIQELFTRNVGNTEQQNKQFPPHKIIGNVYYVGTESLSSFRKLRGRAVKQQLQSGPQSYGSAWPIT